KACRLGERVNRWLVARQEVPIFSGSGPAVLARVNVSLGFGEGRRVFRLEADRDRIKVFSEVQRNRLHGAQFAVKDFGAERGTIEVHEGEHNRALPEVIAQMHGLSILVAKNKFWGDWLVEALGDTYLAQDWR